MPITILGLGGSLREGSTTERALRIALEGAQAEGARVTLLTPALVSLPLFDGTYGLERYAPAERHAILSLLDAVRQAHGLIFASPTYHNTLSGAVKNMLDFLELLRDDQPPRLESKVVGLVTVQEGTSGTGNNTLTTMLLAARAMRAWVTPTMLSIPASRTAFDPDGQAISAAFVQRLQAIGAEVAKASAMFAAHWR